LTLAGKVPESNETHFRAPDREQLALTGQVPTFLVESFVQPGVETLALAGKAPSLDLTISLAREELTLTGKTPLTGQQVLAEPDREQLALAGKMPTVFREKTVAPAIETLSLAGKTPTVGQTYSVAPAKVSLSLSGTVPFTIIPGVEGAFRIPPGFLVLYTRRGLWLDGYTPTVTISTGEITVGKDTLSLAGKTPTLDYSWTVTPAKDELTLAGKTPNIQEFVTQPGEETLSLAGKVPLAKAGPPISIEVGRKQLSLNGYKPLRPYGLLLRGQPLTIDTEGVRTPNPGILSLTGQIPTAVNTTVPPIEVSVPSTALALTGRFLTWGIINPNQESTLIAEGWPPISTASSPTFFPRQAPLVLTGIELISDVEGLAPTEHLFLTGQQPNIDARILTSGAASLSLSSEAPALTTTGVSLPAALLSLTGASVSLRLAISPDNGAVTVASQAPTAFEGVNTVITPAAGSLALSGKAPARNVGKAPLVPAGSSILTGYAVVIDKSESFSIDLIELQLNGHAPLTDVNLNIFPLRGGLTLDTYTYKLKLKRVKIKGARKELISLTTRYDIEQLFG
jgi:hypothetical protein